MAVLRSMPTIGEDVSWSEAIPGVGATMLREFPGITWDRSDVPNEELHRWDRIAKAVLDAEVEWRDSLKERINKDDIATLWAEVRETGARMGLRGSMVSGEHLPPYHRTIAQLMDAIREST